jgi:hypothetical protein
LTGRYADMGAGSGIWALGLGFDFVRELCLIRPTFLSYQLWLSLYHSRLVSLSSSDSCTSPSKMSMPSSL